jgi:hypothetical protein
MKGTDLWVDHHLGWVAIHLTQVLLGFGALDHELLAVAGDDGMLMEYWKK